jgi:hypothetical protein
MARGSNTARRTGTTIFRVQNYVVKAAETFKNYAWVTLDSGGAGTIVEVVAPVPTNKILGLALNGAKTGPGFDVSDSSFSTTNGVVSPQGVAATNGVSAVAIADDETEFSARGVSGATDPVTPLITHIGQQYGLLKTAAGDWVVNIADQANVCVTITDIRPDLGMNLFLFKIIASLQIANL